ncbi:MAG TPA: class I SAM-dependent methyltransferase [Candidatus Acidoferrales bacterium]|nr:class I SAM-dependent methyltransferase [Candidatus Acidoferrales bacterium]
MIAMDSKERFSNRVENYVRYRPGYPQEVLETLRRECSLTPGSAVADVGSGTGILTRLFLENGNAVYGVEPNARMREAGEAYLKAFLRFRSINGTAESTTLPSGSVDFVIAGQAFHWFDAQRARVEFARILKPNGWVAIVWNNREKEATPFLRYYESLLRTYGTDYEQVAQKYPENDPLDKFFGEGASRGRSFANRQKFDFMGLRGRLLSSSYAPPQGHPNHEAMLAELRRIFERHARNGRVVLEYITKLYFGHVQPSA